MELEQEKRLYSCRQVGKCYLCTLSSGRWFFFNNSGCFPGCRVVVVCFPRITLFLARLGLNAGEMLGPTGPALQPLQVPLAVPQPALARAPQQTAHCGLSLG